MPKQRRRIQVRESQQKQLSTTKRTRRGALTLAAAGTATAMALAPIAPTPQADADIVDTVCNDIPLLSCSFTEAGLLTHPFMQILATLYSIPFISADLPPGSIDVPIIGSIDVNALIPAAINRFVWEYPISDPVTIATGMMAKQERGGSAHIIVGVMDGALLTGQAITTIQSNIDPLLGVNNYTYALVRNGGRANGGLISRFDWLYSMTGVSSVSGNVHPESDCLFDTCRYLPVKVDIAVGYDSIDDFPVAPTAVSVLNSFMQSFFLTNLLGERENVKFQAPNNNYYLTIVPKDSALLEPIRIWGRPLSMAGIPDPFDTVADIFEPAADILINIGYGDVDLNTYQRSFNKFNDPNQQFFFGSTLSLDQQFAAVQAAFGSIVDNVLSPFGLKPFAGPATAPASAPGTAASPSGAPANQPAATTVPPTVPDALPIGAPDQPGTRHEATAAQPVDAVVRAASTGLNDAGDATASAAQVPGDDDAAIEGALAGADEQPATAKEHLDDAADGARARADQAACGGHDQGSDAQDQPAETPSVTPATTPHSVDANPADQTDPAGTASTAGDSASEQHTTT